MKAAVLRASVWLIALVLCLALPVGVAAEVPPGGGGTGGDQPPNTGQQVTLTVTVAGTGTGTITSNPQGIACSANGAGCSAMFPMQSQVDLTAVPAAGSTFTEWSGGPCVGNAAACTVFPMAETTVTATFTLEQFTLDVAMPTNGSVTGTGISCGGAASDCSQSFVSGGAVRLEAIADQGYEVSGWNGCDSTAGAFCDVTLNAPRSVSVTFAPTAPAGFILTVTPPVNGSVSGAGIVCGGAAPPDGCSRGVGAGSTVTLVALPDPGFRVGTWVGCDSAPPGTDQCTLLMNMPRTVSLTFVPRGGLPTVTGSVPLGAQPVAQIVVNPATNRVYVGGGYAQNQLTIVDASDVANPVVVPAAITGGSGVTVNPNTNIFYTSDGSGGRVLAYDAGTNVQVGSANIGACPGQFDVDPTRNLVYVTRQCGDLNDPLYVLNGADLSIIGDFLGSGGIVGFPKVNPATGRAYVNHSNGTTVFGPAPGFSILGGGAVTVQGANPLTNRVYRQVGSDLQVVDGNTHEAIATITGAAGPLGIDTTLNRLYVVRQATSDLAVIDGATNAVVGAVTLGPGVTPIAASPAVDSAQHRVYVAGSDGGVTRLYVLHNPGAGLTLAAAAFLGGAGDQRGTALVVAPGGAPAGLYVVGNVQPEMQRETDTALVAKFSLPLAGGAVPAWSRTFGGGSTLYGATATSFTLYGVGHSYSLSSDPGGGKEVKSLLVNFRADGANGPGPSGEVWYRTPNFFSYGGVESHSAAISVNEGDTVVYAAGGGQPCSYSAYIVAKYASDGTLLASATDSTGGVSFAGCGGAFTGGGSEGRALVALNGNVFVVGGSALASEGENASERPTLWKYNAGLSLIQRTKDTTQTGVFRAVTAMGSAIFAVGHTFVSGTPSSENYLIAMFDEAGNLMGSRAWGGAGTDVLTGVTAIGGRLFAVGYTKSTANGDADAVVFEIDPGMGDVMASATYGGAQDDLANGAATDGTDLYVVGESRSFADGANDLMVLRYAVGAAPSTFTLTVTPPANGKINTTGIDCGTNSAGDCTETGTAGAAIPLLATPEPGYHVSAWSGCDTSDGMQCTVILTSPKTISVAFAPNVAEGYRVTVFPVPANGSITGPPPLACGTAGTVCQFDGPANASVTLSAIPDPAYVFTGWIGCEGGANGAQCTVSATRTVSASFAQAVTIVVKSDGSTQAASTEDTMRLETGDVSGLAFAPVIVDPLGTGSSVPPNAPPGTSVVNVPPAPGGHSGFFRAVFTLPAAYPGIQLTGSANADDVGRVFLNGNPITPSIFGADAGQVTHSGNATFSTSNAALFRPGANELVVSDYNSGGGPSGAAFYARITYAGAGPEIVALSVAPPPVNGRVSGAGLDCGNGGVVCQVDVPANQTVTLVAMPAGGYVFTGWTGCDAPMGTHCELPMNAARIVGATFMPAGSMVTLRINVSGPSTGAVAIAPVGLVCNPASTPATCEFTVQSGTPITVSASAPGGSAPGSLTDPEVPAACMGGSVCQFTLMSSKTINAVFDPGADIVTLAVGFQGPAGGIVRDASNMCAGAECVFTYIRNSVVRLSADASGCGFGCVPAGFSGACTTNGSTCEFAIAGSTSVTAHFASAELTLSVFPRPVNGTVLGAGIVCGTGGDACQIPVEMNRIVQLLATPAPGYVVANWFGCDSSDAGSCTATLAASRTVSVSFVPMPTGPSGDFSAKLSCPTTVVRGGRFTPSVTFTNTRNTSRTVTGAAVLMHAGKLRIVGPLSVPMMATEVPGSPEEPNDVPVAFVRPIAVPPQVERGTLLTVGFGFLGRVGTSTQRRLLAEEACVIEVE